jgi:predicted amino acid-binding ACT domain protein
MKNWEFSKVKGTGIKIDDRLADMMGLVDGGCVYSTLFEYVDEGPKKYELILSMYPQENYRTLTNITMYLKDAPGASAQGAKFLANRGINILNSISLDGISDTIIIWKMLVDLSFAGEIDIIRETFDDLKSRNDPSVSKINHIELKPADIGRVFRTEPAKFKNEIKRGDPQTFEGGVFDTSIGYGDVLKNIDGRNIMIVADYASWLISITFFKEETKLVKIGIDIPDCPGSITQALEWIADQNVNLISIFSKIKICYQTMALELVADFSNSKISVAEMKKELPIALSKLNGIYVLRTYEEFN